MSLRRLSKTENNDDEKKSAIIGSDPASTAESFFEDKNEDHATFTSSLSAIPPAHASHHYWKKPWWRKAAFLRWFYYGLAVLLEGFIAGTYTYGYGGGSTVFNLGVLTEKALTVTVFNIASGILVGLGILYQTYQMHKNELRLQKALADSVENQRLHLKFEANVLLNIEGELIQIAKAEENSLARLSACYTDLQNVQLRIAIYTSPSTAEDEVETEAIKQHFSGALSQLESRIAELQDKIASQFSQLGKKATLTTMDLSKTSVSAANEENDQETILAQSASFAYRAIVAFLYVAATAVTTAFLFATPMGWGLLAITIVLTGIYLWADYATKNVEKKVQESEALSKKSHQYMKWARREQARINNKVISLYYVEKKSESNTDLGQKHNKSWVSSTKKTSSGLSITPVSSPPTTPISPPPSAKTPSTPLTPTLRPNDSRAIGPHPV